MAYVLLGILVLGLLGSIYIAVMSSKTWPIYQTVLVVFIYIAAFAFFYLSARTLATHQSWRELYERNLSQAEQIESQILPLEGGVDPRGTSVEGEIPKLRQELSIAARARGGGVFYNVKADSLDAGVLQVTLSPPGTLPAKAEPGAEGQVPGADPAAVDPAAVDPAAMDPAAVAPGDPAVEDPAATDPAATDPAAVTPPATAEDGTGEAEAPAFTHSLVTNSIVYVFEQKPITDGGRYLGEFKVTEGGAESPTVKLAPNLPLSAAQAERLQAAVPGLLTIFNTMPTDSTSLYAHLEPEQRQTLLGGELAQYFANEERDMVDYRTFFHENFVQQGLVNDAILQVTNNIKRIEAATAEAAKEAAYRESEKQDLAADLKGFEQEAKAIADYEQSLEKLLAQVRTQLKATYLENRKAEQTLTQSQLEAAEEINRRTNLASQ